MYRPALHSALALLALALLAASALASTGHRLRPQPTLVPAPTAPPLEPLPAQPPSPPPPPTYLIVAVKPGRTVALRAAPDGAVVDRVGAETEFGSQRTLAVAVERGRWLAVTASERPNGELAWVDGRSPALSERRTSVSLRVSLSRRLLELRVGRRVVERVEVGVGRPTSPTPSGRYALTDKLGGGDYGPYYGCCILALSGHQTSTPAGWQGGDRLAIHGTDDPGTIGAAASAGCLHAEDRDLRLLMRSAPLGAPVFIGA
jgi:lipoprotein-anchoring transpeptidase ErfK/SrfK